MNDALNRDPSIAPADESPGNDALRGMRAELAKVTARENGR